MASIEDRVLESFLRRVATHEDAGAALSDDLRRILAGEKPPKAEAVVQLIIDRTGGTVA